jgi:hypothetical protein
MCKFLILILGSVLSLAGIADDVVTEGVGGGVNWTEGYVWAEGYGVAREGTAERKKRLLARRAAEVDAYRNLAEYINGVRISSETVVREMAVESDVVRSKIEALVRGARIVKDNYQNEIAQVQMRIYFDGDFSSVINRPSLGDVSHNAYLRALQPDWNFDGVARVLSSLGVKRAHAQSTGGRLVQNSAELELANRLLQRSNEFSAKQLLQQLETDRTSFVESSKYSGLLVDARGVPGFELAVIPRIRNREGEIIYPKNDLFSEVLEARRPVSYDFDVQDAIRNARIAITPLIIKAEGTYKARHSDLVISDADARFITSHQQMLTVMQKAGVMIVVTE